MWYPYTSTIALEAERELRRQTLLREARLARARQLSDIRPERRRKRTPLLQWRWVAAR